MGILGLIKPLSSGNYKTPVLNLDLTKTTWKTSIVTFWVILVYGRNLDYSLTKDCHNSKSRSCKISINCDIVRPKDSRLNPYF